LLFFLDKTVVLDLSTVVVVDGDKIIDVDITVILYKFVFLDVTVFLIKL